MNILSEIAKLPSFFLDNFVIGLDIGTNNTRIGIKDKGIVLKEATYIGFNSKTEEYLFFGDEAKQIFGKAPGFIIVKKPVQNGIVSDFDAQVILIKNFLEKAVYPFLSSNKILRSKIVAYTVAPTSSTEVEQKAIEESLLKTGINEVFIFEKPLAVAAGVNFNIFSNKPAFCIDMGAGLCEISVISTGGIITQKTTKIAGEQMNKEIHNYIHLKYGVTIGDQTAENLKINLFNFNEENKITAIRGKSLENGLPKSIRIRSSDVYESLISSFNQIVDLAKEVIETMPPEIIDEIVKNGIILTGGIAKTKGIDKFIAKELKLPVVIPDHPEDSVINGILKLVNDKKQIDRIVIK